MVMMMTGRTLTPSGEDSRYKFVSKELDNTDGLYYFGARYFDSWAGRFPQVDPHYTLYPSLSPYNYAGDNPLSFIDQTGMDSTNYQNQDYNNSSYTTIGNWFSSEVENTWNDLTSRLNNFFSTMTENEGQTSDEQKNDEIIKNQGLTDKQAADLKLHAVNTGIGIATSGVTTAASVDFALAGLGTTDLLTTSSFSILSISTSAANNYINGYLTGSYNFNSAFFSAGLNAAVFAIPIPFLKASISAIDIFSGVGLTSFDYSKQEWNLATNPTGF